MSIETKIMPRSCAKEEHNYNHNISVEDEIYNINRYKGRLFWPIHALTNRKHQCWNCKSYPSGIADLF